MSLRSHTVWDKSFLQEAPQRFRPIYTVLLPLWYSTVAAFAGCYLAARYPGVIAQVTSVQYSDFWATAVFVLAFACGVTGVFRLERAELYASLLFCAGLLLYPISNFIIGATEGDVRQIGLGFAFSLLIYVPGGRFIDIIRTSRRRQ